MTMQQIIARIPDDELAELDQLAHRKHISRAKAMRDAVRMYLDENSKSVNQEAFGLYKKAPVDGLQVQQALREEWGK
ncbi:ribbon-helix-helix domain-containing protein [Kordiimonas pumila]|uniref:Ribbon-helix-helix domain-containing protein n=1 Tax=Kordiimonas pumila TaxID=2161677 RepID=A0ABV7D850_9PROT|nr:ribbon-helix-helix domain-containing protein [Kordiimonas pumila]